jgi:hypothetical protein
LSNLVILATNSTSNQNVCFKSSNSCTNFKKKSFEYINKKKAFEELSQYTTQNMNRRKIFGNKMFQAWSKQLENEGMTALEIRSFLFFISQYSLQSQNTFFYVYIIFVFYIIVFTHQIVNSIPPLFFPVCLLFVFCFERKLEVFINWQEVFHKLLKKKQCKK